MNDFVRIINISEWTSRQEFTVEQKDICWHMEKIVRRSTRRQLLDSSTNLTRLNVLVTHFWFYSMRSILIVLFVTRLKTKTNENNGYIDVCPEWKKNVFNEFESSGKDLDRDQRKLGDHFICPSVTALDLYKITPRLVYRLLLGKTYVPNQSANTPGWADVYVYCRLKIR